MSEESAPTSLPGWYLSHRRRIAEGSGQPSCGDRAVPSSADEREEREARRALRSSCSRGPAQPL